MPTMLGRHLTARISSHLRTFRLVVLGGARQTGKTTLVNELLRLPATFSFDDPAVLEAATRDPTVWRADRR